MEGVVKSSTDELKSFIRSDESIYVDDLVSDAADADDNDNNNNADPFQSSGLVDDGALHLEYSTRTSDR